MKKSKPKKEYASLVEEFIATVFAPESLTHQGKIVILLIWSLMTAVSLYACT